MTRAFLPHDNRLVELLADYAIDGLDLPERTELHTKARLQGLEFPVDPLTCTAACFELALMNANEFVPMPAHVRVNLERVGDDWAKRLTSGAPAVVGMIRPTEAPSRVPFSAPTSAPSSAPARPRELSTLGRIFSPSALPWILAAAAIAIAALAWWPAGNQAGGWTDPGMLLTQLKTSATDLVSARWGDWDNPEVPGVQGEVVWSDAKQAGVMRFVGLPNCKPNERYQLWIIDGTRGMEQRISGGVFDGAKGEILVPIKPGIHVNQAAAFAITIEKPEGTWVSDMKRRVVIAKKT